MSELGTTTTSEVGSLGTPDAKYSAKATRKDDKEERLHEED